MGSFYEVKPRGPGLPTSEFPCSHFHADFPRDFCNCKGCV